MPNFDGQIETFYREYKQYWLAFAQRQGVQECDAEVIIDDSLIHFVKLVIQGKVIAYFDRRGRRLVSRIIHYRVLDLRRAEAIRKHHYEKSAIAGKVVSESDSSRLWDGSHIDTRFEPSAAMDIELKEVINAVFANLTRSQRQMFEARYLYKLSVAQTILELEITLSKYKSRMARLREKLVIELERHGIKARAYIAWLARQRAKRKAADH
jgi:DNA-directed RNA polymerase specialized sigma24 family protein